ncbi:hypothetical protein DSJ_23740 (plasmid) [Pantoea stewartii subsp. stewartii DC283]|uniref:Uncharacterized protein n=1 Tax=Pantoea stewartii subsp. stewartii DC283 TaxID=660596 RepID=H3RKS7_PANSE|nr:hypothetical protein DSJ_23740 [Pantoea stewartii subsp. stewartii DC283]EHT97922.1 hypothetical protein CKS_4614 [Pantoea stewartii subsp. stewartii DC283]
MVPDGLAKETRGDRRMTLRRQQKIDCLTISVNRPVQIFALPSDSDVGFIHSPPAAHCAFVTAKRLIQMRHKADDPPVKRGMINSDTTLCHHFLQITQAE